jgi:hypothetical protein
MREQDRIFMKFSSQTGPNGEEKIYEALSMPFGEAIAPLRLTNYFENHSDAGERWASTC